VDAWCAHEARIASRRRGVSSRPKGTFVNVAAVVLLAKTIVAGLVKPEQGVAFSGSAAGVVGEAQMYK